MAATRQDISSWFDAGVAKKATHMIVVCDTYDHEDYPVYVSSNESVHKVYEAHNEVNMQRVMEVYSFSEKYTKDGQMNERRAFRYD